MLHKNPVLRHLMFFFSHPRLLLTFLLVIYLGAGPVLSPVLAASLIRGAPLPLQFTSTVPETFTTSLQVTVPAGATASTLIVNCYDCDHTDWGSLSINGRVRIAIWPGPGPSHASGTIYIPVPVSAWRTGSNTLAFTHSQYIGGRVDGLTVTFKTPSPPTPSPTTTTPPPPPTTTTPPSPPTTSTPPPPPPPPPPPATATQVKTMTDASGTWVLWSNQVATLNGKQVSNVATDLRMCNGAVQVKSTDANWYVYTAATQIWALTSVTCPVTAPPTSSSMTPTTTTPPPPPTTSTPPPPPPPSPPPATATQVKTMTDASGTWVLWSNQVATLNGKQVSNVATDLRMCNGAVQVKSTDANWYVYTAATQIWALT